MGSMERHSYIAARQKSRLSPCQAMDRTTIIPSSTSKAWRLSPIQIVCDIAKPPVILINEPARAGWPTRFSKFSSLAQPIYSVQ